MDQKEESSETKLVIDTVVCTIGGTIWLPGAKAGSPDAKAGSDDAVDTVPKAVKAKVIIQSVKANDDDYQVTFETETDEQGRYKFGKLKPGDYLLTAQTTDGEIQEQAITVPPIPPYDLTLTAKKTKPTKRKR